MHFDLNLRVRYFRLIGYDYKNIRQDRKELLCFNCAVKSAINGAIIDGMAEDSEDNLGGECTDCKRWLYK